MVINSNNLKNRLRENIKTLNQREFFVLESLINLYIKTGDPVGSRTLSKTMKVPLSPATIRNIMSDLEEGGYLSQPHTSAGRVPTDKGFRYYVNDLLSNSDLKDMKTEEIDLNFSKLDTDLGEFLSYVSEYLSELSGEAAIVLTPDYAKLKLKNINFVRLSGDKMVVIMESESGFIFDRVIKMDNSLRPSELESIQNYLNTNFKNTSIAKIKQNILNAIKEERYQYDQLLIKTVNLVSHVFNKEIELTHFEDLYIKGTSNILNKMNAADIDTMKELLFSFERKSFILEIINSILEDWQKDDIYICIGTEIPEDIFSKCSIIAAPYLLKGENIGFVGIIGPRRMNYSFTIPLVNQIAKRITNKFYGNLDK